MYRRRTYRCVYIILYIQWYVYSTRSWWSAIALRRRRRRRQRRRQWWYPPTRVLRATYRDDQYHHRHHRGTFWPVASMPPPRLRRRNLTSTVTPPRQPPAPRSRSTRTPRVVVNLILVVVGGVYTHAIHLVARTTHTGVQYTGRSVSLFRKLLLNIIIWVAKNNIFTFFNSNFQLVFPKHDIFLQYSDLLLL